MSKTRVFGYRGESSIEGVNVNGLEAMEHVMGLLKGEEPVVVFVTGGMGSGKTTLVGQVAVELRKEREPESVQVFQHVYGVERFGSNTLMTQARKNGMDTGVVADVYSGVGDLCEKVKFGIGRIAMFDEAHFMGGLGKRGPEVDERLLEYFVDHARKSGTSLVMVGLNTTFTREPWYNTRPMLDLADETVLLVASCEMKREGCIGQAFLTQRLVDDGKGGMRSALRDDPLVVVGGVADQYRAACGFCHDLREE